MARKNPAPPSSWQIPISNFHISFFEPCPKSLLVLKMQAERPPVIVIDADEDISSLAKKYR